MRSAEKCLTPTASRSKIVERSRPHIVNHAHFGSRALQITVSKFTRQDLRVTPLASGVRCRFKEWFSIEPFEFVYLAPRPVQRMSLSFVAVSKTPRALSDEIRRLRIVVGEASNSQVDLECYYIALKQCFKLLCSRLPFRKGNSRRPLRR